MIYIYYIYIYNGNVNGYRSISGWISAMSRILDLYPGGAICTVGTEYVLCLGNGNGYGRVTRLLLYTACNISSVSLALSHLPTTHAMVILHMYKTLTAVYYVGRVFIQALPLLIPST